MAVMQTPRGRVIGLILKEDQPKPEPVEVKEEEKKPETEAEAMAAVKRGSKAGRK